VNEAGVRATLEHYWEFAGRDEDVAHEIYVDDAVLEFPQSGELFDGVENFREWRRVYPAAVTFELLRIQGAGDCWVAEGEISYDGGPPRRGVSFLQFRGDKVVRERNYVADPFDAPDWRADWRSAERSV
jgi:SnoaL-like domain